MACRSAQKRRVIDKLILTSVFTDGIHNNIKVIKHTRSWGLLHYYLENLNPNELKLVVKRFIEDPGVPRLYQLLLHIYILLLSI